MEAQSQQHDYFAQASQLVESSKTAVVVNNDEQQKAAVTWLGQAKDCVNAIAKMRKDAIAPHEEKVKAIKSEHDAAINPLKDAVAQVRKMVDNYADLKLRQQQEEQRRREREAEEARMREAQAAEERAEQERKAAQEARERGDIEGAAVAEQRAAQADSEVGSRLDHEATHTSPAPAAPRGRVSTAAGSLYTGAKWDYDLVNIHQVPDDLVNKELRASLVRERLKDLERDGKLKPGETYEDLIPGLRIRQKARTTMR